MNILYINPDPPGMYNYYDDLRKRLCRVANCDSDNPDVVVYGLNWLAQTREEVKEAISLDVPWVCFVHKTGLDWERKKKFLDKCDLVLSSVPGVGKLFKYAADPNIFHNKKLERIFDFGFTGALHSEPERDQSAFPVPHLRRTIQGLARTQEDLSLYLTGSDNVNKYRIKDYATYANILSQSKIWMATTGPDGDIGPRYYEVCMSRTLLFCDEPPKEYQRYFRDGVNCVYFTIDNFVEKLRYYLENNEAREKIVNKACSEFITNHSWSARAWELIDIINATLSKIR